MVGKTTVWSQWLRNLRCSVCFNLMHCSLQVILMHRSLHFILMHCSLHSAWSLVLLECHFFPSHFVTLPTGDYRNVSPEFSGICDNKLRVSMSYVVPPCSSPFKRAWQGFKSVIFLLIFDISLQETTASLSRRRYGPMLGRYGPLWPALGFNFVLTSIRMEFNALFLLQ